MRLFLIVECERQGTGKLPGITSVSKGRAAGEGRGAAGKVGDDAKVRLRARRLDLDVERFPVFAQHDAGFSILVMCQQVSDPDRERAIDVAPKNVESSKFTPRCGFEARENPVTS